MGSFQFGAIMNSVWSILVQACGFVIVDFTYAFLLSI